jgi:hypothetical protein
MDLPLTRPERAAGLAHGGNRRRRRVSCPAAGCGRSTARHDGAYLHRHPPGDGAGQRKPPTAAGTRPRSRPSSSVASPAAAGRSSMRRSANSHFRWGTSSPGKFCDPRCGMRVAGQVPNRVVRLGTGFTITIVPDSESIPILVGSGLCRALDPRGIRLAINGARRDAWSSGMQRDMGEGRVVYLLTEGESEVGGQDGGGERAPCRS